jgi:3-hydroxyacyl-[acyl-carrier-protein] dehydratase
MGKITMSQPSFVFGSKEIEHILPHRYPFLLVDRILHLDPVQAEIVGLKNVTANEPFFQGHFPRVPIMPGVLVLEALAQTGGILVHQKGFSDRIALLLSVSKAKFRRPVRPGDALHLYAKALHISHKGGKMNAKAKVGDLVVVEAELSFALVEKEQL